MDVNSSLDRLVVLRPHWLQRFGMLIPTGVVTAAGVHVLITEATPAAAVAFVILAAPSIYVAIRWVLFAGVVRSSTALVIRGMWWSRRIPLGRVRRVTKGYVVVQWESRRGRLIYSPVTALWSKPRPIETVTEHSDAAVNTIREWVREARKATANI